MIEKIKGLVGIQSISAFLGVLLGFLFGLIISDLANEEETENGFQSITIEQPNDVEQAS